MKQREPHWLNKKQVLASLGISSSTFDAWGVKPVDRIGRETFFTVGAILENRTTNHQERHQQQIARLEREVEALCRGVDDDGRTLEEIKRAKEIAHTKLLEEQGHAQEMKNEVLRHETIPIPFVAYLLGKVATEIRGMHDALPIESGRKLNLKAKDVDTLREIVATTGNAIANLVDEEFIDSAASDYLLFEGIE